MGVSTLGQSRRLRVVQVSFHMDVERREGESLLRAWPTLPSVATAAAQADVDVAVVQRAHRQETFERAGVSYHFIDEPRRRPTRVLECVTALKPDVVHAQGLNFPRAVRSLSHSIPGVPLLVQDHGTVPPIGWRATAWRWAYRSLGGVAFTAREQATPWKRAKILRADLPVFEVLESSTYFTPGDREAARRATSMFGDPCLLWTSRLNSNKDPLTMLAAVEQAARTLPGLRLWCCFGEAPLLDVVRQRIARSPALAERVTLLGNRPHEEMELRFRAADFYLQTSHREAAGFSLLEALACGATPLAADIPATRRIVGAAGSLTPVGDSRSLGNALVAWAARDQRLLRRAARARYDDALTFEAIGRQLRTAYHTLVR
jgi:glycosyltransferase involved in cell wall biosynthesis